MWRETRNHTQAHTESNRAETTQPLNTQPASSQPRARAQEQAKKGGRVPSIWVFVRPSHSQALVTCAGLTQQRYDLLLGLFCVRIRDEFSDTAALITTTRQRHTNEHTHSTQPTHHHHQQPAREISSCCALCWAQRRQIINSAVSTQAHTRYGIILWCMVSARTKKVEGGNGGDEAWWWCRAARQQFRYAADMRVRHSVRWCVCVCA